MPVDDIRFLLVAIPFGALMGWGLVRFAGDLRAVLVATALGTLAGVVAWVFGLGEPGSEPAVAGVSLALGSGAALVSSIVTARRDGTT